MPGKDAGLVKRDWGVEQLRLEFTDFYLANRDDCLRIVLLSAGDRQLAEDLVAEAFARAWASWRKVRVHPAPVAWVVRTALNVNVSWWRRRRREVTLPSGADWAAPRPADAGLRPSRKWESDHERRRRAQPGARRDDKGA